VDAVQRTTRSVGRGRGPSVAPRDIAALAEACRDGRAVRFGYRARDGAPSQRRVEPNALVTVAAVWYLIAYDLDRRDWRLFRVDRTQDVDVTGHGTTRRPLPGGDAMAFLATSLAEMPYPFNATVDVGRRADEVLDELGWLNPRRVEALGRRRCRLRLGAASVEDLVEELVDVLRLDAPTTITAPPEVGQRLAGVAAAIAAAVTG
jgi:predicted DNA-binding transcriptional regulator YafY